MRAGISTNLGPILAVILSEAQRGPQRQVFVAGVWSEVEGPAFRNFVARVREHNDPSAYSAGIEEKRTAMNDAQIPSGPRLNTLLSKAGQESLSEDQTNKLNIYLSLILRWNARVNLTAIRDVEGILTRHFVESIACARALPTGIHTLLDFGSGAGFPGLPIALCRPEIAVTLAESQGKKAAFLREAVRTLGISAQVHSGRAEALAIQFDCVTLRAVDRMEQAVQTAAQLVRPGGWLALMTTRGDLKDLSSSVAPQYSWSEPVPLPGSEDRLLAIGARCSESSCVGG